MKATDEREMPRLLYVFAAVLLALMALCFAVELYDRRVLQLHLNVYAYPVLMEWFPDLVNFSPSFRFFHTRQFLYGFSPKFPFMYPAPVAVVYEVFYRIPRPLVGFLAVMLAGLVSFWALGVRTLMRWGIRGGEAVAFVSASLLCCYPIWFALRQANMELVIWMLVTAGLLLFLRGAGYSAAACFGVAAAMKFFPVVYFGLLFARRQYRQIAWGVAVAVVSTVAALWLVYPQIGETWRALNHGLDLFRQIYMLRVRSPETGVDHSLFALLKVLLYTRLSAGQMATMLRVYLPTVAAVGLLLYFVRIRKLPLVNQVVCLTLASVLLPPTSFEYTLLHLLFPWLLLLLVVIETGGGLPGARAAMACFAVLMGFFPEVILHGRSLDGQIKAVALMALFAVMLLRPMPLEAAARVAGKNEREWAR